MNTTTEYLLIAAIVIIVAVLAYTNFELKPSVREAIKVSLRMSRAA